MRTNFAAAQSTARNAYPRIYRVSFGWKLFLSSVGLVLFVGAAFGLWYFAGGHSADGSTAILLSVVFAAFAALGSYVALWALRARLTLHADGIELTEVVRRRKLRKEDVFGWRTLPQPNMPPVLVLVPREGRGRPLKVTQSFKLDDSFYDWLRQFTNLDVKDQVKDEEEILSNIEFGASREERLSVLQRAKRVSQFFLIVTFLVAAWGWFHPQPYRAVIAVLAALPLLALVMASRSGGLYRLDQKRNDAHPNLAIPFMLPGAILALRAVTDFEILGWPRIGLICLGIGVILGFLAAACDSSLRTKPVMLLPLVFCTSMYGLGAGLEANALLDNSPPLGFSAAIVDKHISGGKRTDYRLKLLPWGPQTEQNTVSVSRRVYAAAQPGDRVCIELHQGALRVPWYIVGLCR